LENWVTPYSEESVAPFNAVYYAFLTLAEKPNSDNPPEEQWDGKAIYESMAQADVVTVMTQTDPTYDNPYDWQRAKIQAMIDDCKEQQKLFMWSIGGWSDLTKTISDEQIPQFVEQVVSLLKLGGDGVDLDWEHLSNYKDTDPALFAQQRAIMGKTITALRSGLNDAGMEDKYLSYTTRWNCFWRSSEAANYGALTFSSDGECIDSVGNMSSPDDVSWINLMMYDASPGTAFTDHQYFQPDNYKAVLSAGSEVVSKSQLVMGFEPGFQAGAGIWEGFDIDFEVIDYMESGGYGGIMFWALNERATDENPDTPASETYVWQGSTGGNCQYMAGIVNSS